MATFNKLNKQKDLLEPNDGVRNFSIYTNTCYDKSVPFDSSEQTRLKITDHRHDLNELSKSFINFEFEVKYKFANHVDRAAAIADNVPNICFFLGWKNASDILKTLQIENANIDTHYLQRECARESFCMNCMKPHEVKTKNKFSHTLYEDARTGAKGVCGTYITSTDSVTGGREYTTNINVVLPISDITCLQAFPDFPTMLGDIVLKFDINKESMVWCQCDPYEITVNNTIHNSCGQPVDTKYKNVGYERRFVQVGQTARCIESYETLNLQDNSIIVNSLVCKKCTCDIYGYNVQPETKQEIYNIFNETQYIPAQQLDVVNFIEPYRGGSYHSNISQQIHNVTNFVVVLPEKGAQTCYRNPMLNNLQFICDNVGYPHKPFDNTYDARFYTTMMRAGDQENFFEAENDYRNSVYRRRKRTDKNRLSDISSFMISFQAERNCNGNYYDGIDTDTRKVSIELKFSSSDLDVDTSNPQKPQVWFVRDTYWTLDNKDGLKYHKSGTPPNA